MSKVKSVGFLSSNNSSTVPSQEKIYPILLDFNGELDRLKNKPEVKKKNPLSESMEVVKGITKLEINNTNLQSKKKPSKTVALFYERFNAHFQTIINTFQTKKEFPNSFAIDELAHLDDDSFYSKCNTFLEKLLIKHKEKGMNLIAKLIKIGFVLKCVENRQSKDDIWKNKNLSTFMKHHNINVTIDTNLKRRSTITYSVYCKFPCFFMLSESDFGSGYSVQNFIVTNSEEIIKQAQLFKNDNNSPFHQMVSYPLPNWITQSFAPIL